MKFWAGLFLLGAGLGCILGWDVWPGIFAGADAAPYRTVLRALAVPAGYGLLGVSVAFAVRRFAEDRFLWLAVVAAAGAVPAGETVEFLLVILIVLEAGSVVPAWYGSTGFSFLAGACGGFAIWLTPAAVPAVLLVMAPLFIRWLRGPNDGVVITCAAGFVDVIGFGYAVHPPKGGYLALDIHHLSVLYVLLGVVLLAAATLLRRLKNIENFPRRRLAGAAIMVGLLLLWLLIFLYYARNDDDFLKAVNAPDWRFDYDLAAGILALTYVIWRAIAARGAWPIVYLACCIPLVLALARYFPFYAGLPAVIAAALAPVAVSELLQKLRKPAGLPAPWPKI